MSKSKSLVPTQKGLPQDIIEDVLARLPVKSLLKFRCVNKSWCCLIGSKTFIKTHLKYSKHTSIILNTMQGLGHCSLPSLLNDPYTPPDSIHYINVDGINVEGDKISVVGCCNGLVCILADRKRFILWNPSTRKSKNLPDIDNTHHGYQWIPKFGFGFDEGTDDYKVFGILMNTENDSRYHHPLSKIYYAIHPGKICYAIGKVYSLKSDSWEETHTSICDDIGAGIYASGKLNWLTHSYHNYNKLEIVSFDLNSYSNGVVELPELSFSHDVGLFCSLRVDKGCLLLLGFCHPVGLYIWIMKEYGVIESWDRVASFPYYNDPHDGHPFGFQHSFTITWNGEVLVISNSNFRIYNPKRNAFRYIPVANTFPFYESGIYIQSLASVLSDSELTTLE